MSLGQFKAFLALLMAMGAVVTFGGVGTFASFSAQTTNAGSAITSGTLTLSDTVGSNSVCLSSGSGSTNNNNPSCPAVLTLPNVAPGAFGGIAQVAVKNTGSIDARDLWLAAPSVNTTLSGTLGTGATSLPVASLGSAVVKGQ